MRTFKTYLNLVLKEFDLTKKDYLEWCYDEDISITKCRKMFHKKNKLMVLSCIKKKVTMDSEEDIYEYFCIAYYIIHGEIFQFD